MFFENKFQVLDFIHDLKNLKDFDYNSNVNHVSIMGLYCEDLLRFFITKNVGRKQNSVLSKSFAILVFLNDFDYFLFPFVFLSDVS